MIQTTQTVGWHTAANLMYAENQDGAVLIDEDQGLRFIFDHFGNRIWKNLLLKRSIPDITKAISSEFHIPEEQVAADVAEFIADLKFKRLVLSTEDLQTRLCKPKPP